MKKILAVLILNILFIGQAFALTCADNLVPLFKAEQAAKLCSSYGGLTSAGDLQFVGASSKKIIFKLDNDVNRLAFFVGGSDTSVSLKWGDATTAAQTFAISANTADAADDGILTLASGGGGTASGQNRGAFIQLLGNEAAGSPGEARLYAGNVGTAQVLIHSNVGAINLQTAGTTKLSVANTGAINLPTANDLNFSVGLATVAFQEAVAGTACSGTLTANGATPVVTSTTCATTGSRIFLSRTSAETGVVTAWISALSNGVSFSITGEAGDTGTYNWVIFHEAP